MGNLTSLTELTVFSGDESFYVVEDDDGTPVPRKVTVENLIAGLRSLTLDAAYAPLAGPYVKDYARATRSSGNVTLNSTSWANVDTGVDLSLTAATGDVIEVCPSGRLAPGPSGNHVFFDVATIVGGSPVNYFATAGGSTDEGAQGWRCQDTVDARVTGSISRTLVSGDISSGTVTLRLRYRGDTAQNRTWVAGSTNPFIWYAKNLGPAT